MSNHAVEPIRCLFKLGSVFPIIETKQYHLSDSSRPLLKYKVAIIKVVAMCIMYSSEICTMSHTKINPKFFIFYFLISCSHQWHSFVLSRAPHWWWKLKPGGFMTFGDRACRLGGFDGSVLILPSSHIWVTKECVSRLSFTRWQQKLISKMLIQPFRSWFHYVNAHYITQCSQTWLNLSLENLPHQVLFSNLRTYWNFENRLCRLLRHLKSGNFSLNCFLLR